VKPAAAVLSCLALAAGCTGGDRGTEASTRAQVEQPTGLDAARLRALDLTYEVPAQVGEACAEARRLATVRVVCPPLVPDVPLTRLEGLWGSMVVDSEPRFYMLSFNNGGLPGGKRHWITGGGNADVVAKWVLAGLLNEVPGEAELVRTITVRGQLVSIYHFPPPAGGPNVGHWAAFVRIGDEVVFASPHERRFVGAAVEMALALAEELAATTAAGT
jgi:hypothetical protein